MATNKITLNELRALVAQIIKEDNEFKDTSDLYDREKERFDVVNIYEKKLLNLFKFNKIKDAYVEFYTTFNREISKLSSVIMDRYSEKDRGYLTLALSSIFKDIPSTSDINIDKIIEQIVDIAIKK
jgi:hypothetical protein